MTLAFVKLYQIFIVRGPKNQKIQQLVIVHQAHWNSRFGEVFQGEHLALFEPGQVLPAAADPMAIGDVESCAYGRDSNVSYEFKNKFLVSSRGDLFDGFLIVNWSLFAILGFGILEFGSKKIRPRESQKIRQLPG